ncbi:hypothetical protein ACFYOF_16580 [Streptomyces sp. NPDC007148]|uniref:hypothetical protein n=1 Tax=Streptomyces sp. NPDC007148 TaxID=3364775 RepID=UPI00369CBF1D
MIGETSAREVLTCVFFAITLFSGSLVPFFLFVEAEHFLPRAVRELPDKARVLRDEAALTAAVLLLLLTAPKGVTR